MHGGPNEETREQILKVAREIFYDQGYENTSMDEIYQAAHVSRSTVYYYFKSKDSIRSVIGIELWNKICLEAKRYCGNHYAFITTTTISWYAFFKDENYRRFFIGYCKTNESNDEIFGAYLSRLVCDCFGRPSSQLSSFLDDRPVLLYTIMGAEYALYDFYIQHLEEYTYLDASKEEFSAVARLLAMPDVEIEAVWNKALKLMTLIDWDALDTTLG